MNTNDKRVRFDFEIDFSNGGGIQGQDFRLDIEGDDIDDSALAEPSMPVESARPDLSDLSYFLRDEVGDLELPAHSMLLAAGIPIVGRLARLNGLPTEGVGFSAVPTRIRRAAALPVRAWARVVAGLDSAEADSNEPAGHSAGIAD